MAFLSLCWGMLATAGCERARSQIWSAAAEDARRPDAAPEFHELFDEVHDKVPPRKGMIWIPGGTLLAGTTKDKIPRIAEEELPGVPIELEGFYIDEFAYPNEPGAIPKTGVSRDEAAGLCAQQNKRLCSELEWERACKGPSNTTYEYGEVHRPGECGTGVSGRLTPSGLQVGCKSAFGVHDMHGGPWEWTSSPWRTGSMATLRGGNGEAGEVVGRCANGMGRVPTARKSDASLRCCAGNANTAEVKLPIVRGKTLEARPLEPAIVKEVERLLSGNRANEVLGRPPWRIDRTWLWHPIGNEELLLASACGRDAGHLLCGVVVTRPAEESLQWITVASSGWWMTIVKVDYNGRDLWVRGGDGRSGFRVRLSYLWGRIVVGDLERLLHIREPTAE